MQTPFPTGPIKVTLTPGVQNCYQNFDSNPKSGEINVFVFFPMRHKTYLYVIHVPLRELELPYTIKKSVSDLNVILHS